MEAIFVLSAISLPCASVLGWCLTPIRQAVVKGQPHDLLVTRAISSQGLRVAVWPSVFSWQNPILSKGDFLYLNLTRTDI